MQTIITKYHRTTNRRGPRISATALGGQRVVVSYRFDRSHQCEHHKAARTLCEKLGWTGRLVCGRIPVGNVYVFDPAVRSDQLEIVD